MVTVSYVELDPQRAQVLGRLLQDGAVQADDLRRSVAVALTLADLDSHVPIQLGVVQDDFARIASGVADKADLAAQYAVQPPLSRVSATDALDGLRSLARSFDASAAMFGFLPAAFDAAPASATAGLNPVGDAATGDVFPSTRTLLGMADSFGDTALLSAGVPPLLAGVGTDADSGLVLAQSLPTPRPEFVPRPRVVIAVIGNSYTSGEGADVDTYERVDVPVNGVPMPMIHPAHRSPQAAAMQVIDRLKAENPDVDFEVRFVAVSGATPDRIMYGPTHDVPPFDTTRPQIDAAGAQLNIPASEWLSMADVVILGEGGNPHFNAVVSQVMQPGNSYTPELHRELLGILTDPAFRQQQREIQDAVLSRMNPQGTLIVTGYPKILPDVMPPSSELYNPFSPAWAPVTGTMLYTEELQMANSFAFELNWQLDSAVSRTGQLWSNRTVLFANPWGAFDGQFLFSPNPAAHAIDWNAETGLSRSFHPTPEGFRLLTDFYEPYLRQGVQRAIDRQRPPAPDAPDRQGAVDPFEDPFMYPTRLADLDGSYSDLMVPAGITLATGSSMDTSWASPYLTGEASNPLPGTLVTGDLAGFDTAAFATEGVPDFGAATDSWWSAPYAFDAGGFTTADLGLADYGLADYGLSDYGLSDFGMADFGAAWDGAAAYT